jgi:hypothetical protein
LTRTAIIRPAYVDHLSRRKRSGIIDGTSMLLLALHLLPAPPQSLRP